MLDDQICQHFLRHLVVLRRMLIDSSHFDPKDLVNQRFCSGVSHTHLYHRQKHSRTNPGDEVEIHRKIVTLLMMARCGTLHGEARRSKDTEYGAASCDSRVAAAWIPLCRLRWWTSTTRILRLDTFPRLQSALVTM